MAGTWADVLDAMELLNNELECGAGEDDEASALLACTLSLYQFENIARSLPRCLGTVVQTSTATAGTETTAWPSSLLRFDGMFVLDANGRPSRRISRLQEIGGQAPSVPWPLNLMMNATGAPAGYFTDMANFYWMPIPDATYTLRIHGLFAAAVPATRATPYTLEDHTKLAMAQGAVFLAKYGVDDAKGDLAALETKVFRPLLRGLRKFDRSEPVDRHYSHVHTT